MSAHPHERERKLYAFRPISLGCGVPSTHCVEGKLLQANRGVGAATAGGGFSITIAGQLGIAPGNYLSAACSAAFPDQKGMDFLSAMSQLNGMTW